ncbi:MAG: PIN domain-containing protein [Candidatus Sulfotelmatobacter sp.]
MPVILDTDVVIRGERGLFDLASWLETQAESDPAIAAITVAELWHGIERASAAHRPRREAYVKMITKGLPVLHYTEATAIEHARVWAELESSGKMIGYYDLIVAATALEHGSAVATFNKRHFQNIDRLTVIEPK